MIKLDGMLMIGSAGANVGKTELACALIKKFSGSANITGIKVTTIKAKDGQCPRGGLGCGVCSSLDGDFCITEETDSESKKDTARLLAAGAKRVFWLRVLKKHLNEGLTALLDIIGPDAISICESNSLRQVVEPGLFLIVKTRNSKTWKRSAQDVKEYADKIVVTNSRGFYFDLNRIKLTGRKWTLQKGLPKREKRRFGAPERAAAIIMAGGESSRIGVDKSMLPVEGQPMIKHIHDQLRPHFSQILVSSNCLSKYSFLGVEVVPDRVANQGPLMGIASALGASDNELNFVVACDIPHIDIRFVRKMLAEAQAVDMVIPTTGNGKHEPLFAIYNKSALKCINKVLSSGKRKISDAFPHCNVKYINLKSKQFTNLNTMEEYEEFQKKYDTEI
jgi:molybdopterin-guanine dinucleotide biosynthesis protein A